MMPRLSSLRCRRPLRIVALTLVMLGTAAVSASAQLTAATFDARAPNGAWVAGGIGGGSASGFVAEWDVGASHGPLMLGYVSSSVDNARGSSNHEHAWFGGVRVPQRNGYHALVFGLEVGKLR